MKSVILCIALFIAAAANAATPTELTLASGTVLKRVIVVRWETERVIVKHAGGSDTIYYKYMAPASRAAFESSRDAEMNRKTTGPAAAQLRIITGQVFVPTRGAGSYKFGGATVSVFHTSEIEAAKSAVSARLPAAFSRLTSWERDVRTRAAWLDALKEFTPSAETTTDADGKYSVKLDPAGEYMVFCTVVREVVRSAEYTTWIVPIKEENVVDLNSKNEWTQSD